MDGYCNAPTCLPSKGSNLPASTTVVTTPCFQSINPGFRIHIQLPFTQHSRNECQWSEFQSQIRQYIMNIKHHTSILPAQSRHSTGNNSNNAYILSNKNNTSSAKPIAPLHSRRFDNAFLPPKNKNRTPQLPNATPYKKTTLQTANQHPKHAYRGSQCAPARDSTS